MWSPDTLKAVSRFARQGTAIASWTTAQPVRDALRSAVSCSRTTAAPPDATACAACSRPPGRCGAAARPRAHRTPGRCAVIGAGLAGAAVAASLARRGWQVTVLDAADRPAAGASGLPVGMLAPHVSPDDALLSRLTRAGIRATWSELVRLLEEGRDWRASGVLERRPDGDTRVPAGWSDERPQ
jgi:tRNA 5-methylaminomethyl-2-thiouridine biosynthesis bifunctional protein